MQLYYNGVALHNLCDELTIHGPDLESVPVEAPLRQRATLRVQLETFQSGWQLNRTRLDAIRTALKTQQAVLHWVDEASAITQLNQTAVLLSSELPDGLNGAGTWRQAVVLVFQWWVQNLTPNTLTATFTKTGGSPLTLGHVEQCRRSHMNTRVHALRKQRWGASGRILLSGHFQGDTTQTLAVRRAALQNLVDLWMAAVQAADGLLAYGTFSQLVRVDEFQAEVNQAGDAIPWTISASWTRFPNEAGYALAEYETTTSTNLETGRMAVTLAGRIGAQSEAAARTKLAALRAALIDAQPAGRTLRLLNTDSRAQQMDADTDGTAFIELTFTDQYEGKLTGGDIAVRYTLRVRDDFLNRTRHTQVQGSVFAHIRADADWLIALVLAGLGAPGTRLESERSEERGQYRGVRNTAQDDIAEYVLRVEFSDAWISAMTGEDLIIECELAENIRFSGPRLVPKPTAFGRMVVQECGIEAGERMVQGRVKAASEASAVAWARRQQWLPISGSVGAAPDTRYRFPPEWSLVPGMLPLSTGVVRAGEDEYTGGDEVADVPVWTVSFSFREILPDFDYDA